QAGHRGPSPVRHGRRTPPSSPGLGSLAQPHARLSAGLLITYGRTQMSTIRSADGTSIGYTRIGQGPPLILVDGALCSRSFGPIPKRAAQLAPHFTVYTYDRRGRGESGNAQPYAAEREIEDLEALVTQAGESVFVHGTSSGAALALEAAKQLRSITRLALYEP